MKIDVYADTTPWDINADDNCIRISVPKKIVFNYYKQYISDDEEDFWNWYRNEYTCDDTTGLYGYAIDNNVYPVFVKYPTLGREVDVEELALLYAEKHAVIEYHLERKDGKDYLVYYTSYPIEHVTYKAVVDLYKWKEKRMKLNKYYTAYESKIGGMYTANYCA